MSVRPGEQEEQHERGRHGGNRERDRNRGRAERPEDDEQHDQRGEQAQQLLCALLDGRELGVAVELHGQACRLERLANGVLDRHHRLAILLVDHAVELRLGVGDPGVVGDVVGIEGIPHARQAGLVLGGLELRRLGGGDRLDDRRPVFGLVEPLALRRRDDDVQHAALLLGELGLDQVGRLLRVGARDLELVLQLAADRRDQDDQRGEDPDPREDDAPRVRRARAHPARQRAGRKPLVRRETLAVGVAARLQSSILIVLRHEAPFVFIHPLQLRPTPAYELID